jgi:hypothetical protein
MTVSDAKAVTRFGWSSARRYPARAAVVTDDAEAVVAEMAQQCRKRLADTALGPARRHVTE